MEIQEHAGEKGMSMGHDVAGGAIERYWVAAILYAIVAALIWVLSHWVWAVVPAVVTVYAATMAIVTAKQQRTRRDE